jgi:hypothetical protein
MEHLATGKDLPVFWVQEEENPCPVDNVGEPVLVRASRRCSSFEAVLNEGVWGSEPKAPIYTWYFLSDEPPFEQIWLTEVITRGLDVCVCVCHCVCVCVCVCDDTRPFGGRLCFFGGDLKRQPLMEIRLS